MKLVEYIAKLVGGNYMIRLKPNPKCQGSKLNSSKAKFYELRLELCRVTLSVRRKSPNAQLILSLSFRK